MTAPARNLGLAAARRAQPVMPVSLQTAAWVMSLLPLAGALGCKHEEASPGTPAAVPIARAAPPTAAPAPAAPDPAASGAPPQDLRAATAWIDALRGRSPAALVKETRLPFDLRNTRRGAGMKPGKAACANRVATNPAGATAIGACLAQDAQLHADLAAMPELRLFEIDPPSFPPWAQPWTKTLRPGLRGLSTFVHGDSDVHELVLLVGDDGVHGLWQNVTQEPK